MADYELVPALGELRPFEMGTLEVAPGASVTFVDNRNNRPPAPPEPEALYVHTLILGAGANVTLAGGNIYYSALVDDGATVTSTKGQILEVSCVDAYCDDGDVCNLDRCVGVTCTHTVRQYGDIDGDADVDLDDILCLLDGFAGNFDEPAHCTLVNIDIAPCPAGDGIIDLFDVLGILDAFQGMDVCGCQSAR